ncbi:MAG TPA: S24/S26 family peptidase, partial [Thermoanaerobaculia bacterium]
MTLKVDAAEVIIDLLQRGHAVEFRARGDSMHPVIREHDALHVEPTQQCKVGDVILARAERGLTAHRVLAIRGDVIITRGDNTPAPDPPLPRPRILGKVTWVERDGKRLKVAREFVLLRALRTILARRKSGAAGFSPP